MIIRYLLQEKKIPQNQIFFYNLEDPKLLSELNETSINKWVKYLIKNGANIKKRVYVFIDEIQYLDKPSSFLKQVFDLYPQVKLIVSGSSSFEMKKKFTDRLTGRKRFVEILPLSFSEIRDFQGGFQSNETEDKFLEYLLYGGYPRVILRENLLEKRDTLLEIYNDYVRKDIRDLARIPEISAFNNFVGIAASQIGNLVSDTEISGKTGMVRQTVNKYFHLLESTYILSLIRPYSRNPRGEFIKMPKVYFLDTGLRNAVAGGFIADPYRSDIGALAENGVYCELLKNLPPFWEIYFWRTKQDQEVDFIIHSEEGKIFPVEVKFQNFSLPEVPRSLVSFIEKYKISKGYIITKNFSGEKKVSGAKIIFIPASGAEKVFSN